MPMNFKYSYPQKYFLEKEACKYFGIKHRSFRRLIDDGKIKLKVTAVNKKTISCQVMHGGKLSSKKGVNFPNTQFSFNSITSFIASLCFFALIPLKTKFWIIGFSLTDISKTPLFKLISK